MTATETNRGDSGAWYGHASKLLGIAFRSGAPAVLFVAVSAVAPLCVAAPVAVAMALEIAAMQWRRRRSATSALIGLGVTLFCTGVAALTGETRDFFLLPMVVPFGALLLCLVTIILKRPLVGLIVNPLVRGPHEWANDARLRRLHAKATWLCIGINIVNGTAQVASYMRDQSALLAIIHVAVGPVFGLVVLVTGMRARRIARAY